MSDNDQLTNSAEVDRLSGSLSGVTVPKPPSLDAIMSRGRARRRHRRFSVAGLFLAGAGIAAALLVGPTNAPGAPLAPAASRTLGAIHTAAYTIVLNGDGTATLTIDPNEMFDPERLQSDLDQYGIPAKVTVGSFCTSDPAPAGLSQVVSYKSQPNQEATITIDPTSMPSGAELSFGEFKLRMGVQMVSFALIDKGSYTCSDSVPTDSPNSSPTHGGLIRLYGLDAP
jgi:hypothetical protein